MTSSSRLLLLLLLPQNPVGKPDRWSSSETHRKVNTFEDTKTLKERPSLIWVVWMGISCRFLRKSVGSEGLPLNLPTDTMKRFLIKPSSTTTTFCSLNTRTYKRTYTGTWVSGVGGWWLTHHWLQKHFKNISRLFLFFQRGVEMLSFSFLLYSSLFFQSLAAAPLSFWLHFELVVVMIVTIIVEMMIIFMIIIIEMTACLRWASRNLNLLSCALFAQQSLSMADFPKFVHKPSLTTFLHLILLHLLLLLLLCL